MKATIGTFFFISLFITSCTTKMKTSESDNSNKTTIVDAHNAQNALDYVGIFLRNDALYRLGSNKNDLVISG
jgi:hypothetical protein